MTAFSVFSFYLGMEVEQSSCWRWVRTFCSSTCTSPPTPTRRRGACYPAPASGGCTGPTAPVQRPLRPCNRICISPIQPSLGTPRQSTFRNASRPEIQRVGRVKPTNAPSTNWHHPKSHPGMKESLSACHPDRPP